MIRANRFAQIALRIARATKLRKPFQESVEIDDALGFPGLKNQFQNVGVLQQEMKVLIFSGLV